MFILFFTEALSYYQVLLHTFPRCNICCLGNARGGIKGAVAGAALNGILITFLPLLFIPFLGDLGLATTTFSDTDFLAVGIIFGNIVKYAGIIGSVIFIVILAAGAIFLKGKADKKYEQQQS